MRTASPLSFALLAVLCALAGGCASGTGAKWYAPATWLSHRPADNVDKTEGTQTKARHGAIKAAQIAVHETNEALSAAPASRPVEVATESNAAAMSLLDQAAGPLTAGELATIRKQVAGLLSENAKLRADAEKTRDKNREADAALSEKLAKADAAVLLASGKLREAFDRENALANELRGQRALVWILGGVALIAALAWGYVQVMLGGMPAALGQAKRMLESKHPDLAAQVAPIYARFLDKRHQSAISTHSK